jgi:hypothetical protein
MNFEERAAGSARRIQSHADIGSRQNHRLRHVLRHIRPRQTASDMSVSIRLEPALWRWSANGQGYEADPSHSGHSKSIDSHQDAPSN